MTDKVQKIREDVEKLKSQLLRGACSSQIAMETRCKEEAYDEVLALLNTMQKEPVSEEIEWRTDKPQGNIIVAKIAESFCHEKECYEVLHYAQMPYPHYYDAWCEEIPYSAIEKWDLIK